MIRRNSASSARMARSSSILAWLCSFWSLKNPPSRADFSQSRVFCMCALNETRSLAGEDARVLLERTSCIVRRGSQGHSDPQPVMFFSSLQELGLRESR